MRIHKLNNYNDISELAAVLVTAQLARKPESVLGLATGSTPLGLYERLIAINRRGLISFAKAESFNLDEYFSLSAEHPASFARFMRENLLDHIDIDAKKAHLPDGTVSDPGKELQCYDDAIVVAGGIDLQILGLGHDGHIGFNMPSDTFVMESHVVELTEQTRQANARFFDGNPEKVPEKALTLGMKGIMSAGQIVLLVSGSDKAQVLHDTLYGAITPRLPASILQLHNNLDVIYCGD